MSPELVVAVAIGVPLIGALMWLVRLEGRVTSGLERIEEKLERILEKSAVKED